MVSGIFLGFLNRPLSPIICPDRSVQKRAVFGRLRVVVRKGLDLAAATVLLFAVLWSDFPDGPVGLFALQVVESGSSDRHRLPE